MQDKSKLPILIFPEGKLLCGEAVQAGESRVALEEPVFPTSDGGPLGWSRLLLEAQETQRGL